MVKITRARQKCRAFFVLRGWQIMLAKFLERKWWWVCWLFVFSVTLFDVWFTVVNAERMCAIEDNPIQHSLLQMGVGGFLLAVMFRLCSTGYAFCISFYLCRKWQWAFTCLMVLCHAWVVTLYMLFIWIESNEATRLFLKAQK